MKNLLKYLFTLFTIITLSTQHSYALSQVVDGEDTEFTNDIKKLIDEGASQGLFPGLAAVIYKNQKYEIITSGGADLNGESVKSDTLFQLGSVGKLLTAIVALQLVEEGKLDLHKPITLFPDMDANLHCLLTHSCGFNDRNIGYMAPTVDQKISLEDYISKAWPGNFQTSGQSISYSNYSYALIGYLVEKAENKPFVNIVQTRIFDRLNMTGASLSFVDSYQQHPKFAKAYSKTNDGFKEVRLYPSHATPAGSLIASAQDMALFLQALSDQSPNLLDENSWHLMFTEQFSNASGLSGYSYGMEVQHRGNTSFFAKGGQLPGMLSAVMVVPGQFGFFYVINTNDDTFGEQFFPNILKSIPQSGVKPIDTSSLNLDVYTGPWRNDRYNRNTAENIISSFRGAFDVWLSEESGKLVIWHNGKLWTYRPIKQHVFQNEELPDELMIFEEGVDGTIKRMYRNQNIGGLSVPATYEKVSWYASPEFVNEYYAFIPLAALLGLVAGLFAIGRRLILRLQKKNSDKKGIPLAIYAMFAVSAVLLILHLIIGPIHFLRNTNEYLLGVPQIFQYSIWVGYLYSLASLINVWAIFIIWKHKNAGVMTRVIVSISAVAGLLHAIYLYYWNFM